MKRIATLLAAVSVFAVCTGSAVAWNQVTGMIEGVDQQNRKIVLDDGRTYNVASNVTLEGLRPGDKVRASTDVKDGAHVIRGIEQTGQSSAPQPGATPSELNQPMTPAHPSPPPEG